MWGSSCTLRRQPFSTPSSNPRACCLTQPERKIMNPAKPSPTPAFATVDLDRPGKQVGFVMIPHSPDDDAWGVTRIPISVISNGQGPTVILEGGNHGDEYEGPKIGRASCRERG